MGNYLTHFWQNEEEIEEENILREITDTFSTENEKDEENETPPPPYESIQFLQDDTISETSGPLHNAFSYCSSLRPENDQILSIENDEILSQLQSLKNEVTKANEKIDEKSKKINKKMEISARQNYDMMRKILDEVINLKQQISSQNPNLEPLDSSPQNIIEQVPKLNSPAQLTQPVYIVENIVKPLKK